VTNEAAVDATRSAGTRAGHRRIRVILNRSAGLPGGLHGTTAPIDRVRALLDRHGIEAEIAAPIDEAAASAAIRQAIGEGVDVVVAAGGDGTVHLVADALIDTPAALGILPMGRVMNVARSLGIGRDIESAAVVLATGHVRAMDVGLATTADGRTVPFLEAGSVGLNAAVFREVARAEAGDPGSIARTIWVALRYRPARMTIELDDEVVHSRGLMVSVSIGPYLGLGMTVAPNASVDDGRFDVRVFRGFSKWELLRHLGSIAFGRRRYAPRVSTYRSASVRITSVHPLPARADPVDLGQTPVTFRTRPRALRVVAPAPEAPAPEASSAEASAEGGSEAGQPAGGGSSSAASGRRRM
jgi:diacylglycerol kinase (ATP)